MNYQPLTPGQRWYRRIMGAVTTSAGLFFAWLVIRDGSIEITEAAFVGGIIVVGCILGQPSVFIPAGKYIVDAWRERK